MAKLSYRQSLVGRAPAGMHGLDELFEELYEQGHLPGEADLGLELVERAQAHNYIPKVAVDDFAQALLRLGVNVVTVSLDGANPDTYADVRRGGRPAGRVAQH